MSNLCKTQLCATVQNAADNSSIAACTVTDALFSTVAIDVTQSTNRTSKITFNNLPDASTVSNGHIIYLDDAKVPVIASNGTWIGFDGRTVGTFIENQLWAWGCNGSGRLGDGTITNSCSPVLEFCSATDWCQVSAGGFHTAAIKTSGQIWGWGSNSCGRLGDGTATDRCSPVREISSSTDWCFVSTATAHAAAVKTSGELWAWGCNSFGRLGDGTAINRCSPVREFCSAEDWCQVSAGGEHTAAVKTSGQIWTWGFNRCGQLGDGTITERFSPVREICSATDWCQVSAGGIHIAAIKISGQLWSWGLNTCGRLGDGTASTRCSPVQEISSATDWCQVSAGGEHTAAIKTSGQIWGWGNNGSGRLGDGTITTRFSPVREISSATDWCQVSAGGAHTAAIKTSGQIWGWGNNDLGRLGDGTITSRCSPVQEISSATDWCQASAGGFHTAAVKAVTCVCR